MEGDSAKPPAEAWRRAVVFQVEARRRARDPGRATQVWAALMTGRGSIVDSFEREGRRYVVVRENDSSIEDRALRNQEMAVLQLAVCGMSNKLIAYELGLSSSTAGTHLRAAMRKIGIGSRAELVGLFAALRKRADLAR
jgi:DNA-binding NarL/FixJ family response regulator